MEKHHKTSIKLKTKLMFKVLSRPGNWLRLGLVFFLIGVALMFNSLTVEAASLYFSPSSGSYNVGSNFSVSVFVSSSQQEMNAAGGVILFPEDKLEITSLSKSSSILTFWAQEPSFSNTAGRVNFEGVILPDGFKGQAGRIITLNFKVKAAGNASLNFLESSVLAHDGRGTNILTNLTDASFSLGLISIRELPIYQETTGFSGAPDIYSPTHPDPEKWYSNPNPKFEWPVPRGINSVRLLVGKNPTQNPAVVYTPSISERQLENLDDGIWYFSAQFRDSSGWGAIGRFKFQIDTTPPLPFEIIVEEGKETTISRPTLVFETRDEVSGIDYYEIRIGTESLIKTEETRYKMPEQEPGKYIVNIKAFDKAGNYKLATTEIDILPIEIPVITDYPNELLPGSTFFIGGTSIPELVIKIYFQRNGKETRTGEIKSDKDGNWTYIETVPIKKGIYEVWVETVDFFGGKSLPSEKIIVKVGYLPFIKIGGIAISYLFFIIILLISVVAFIVIKSHQKEKERKEIIKKEINEVEKILYESFKLFKKEIENQILKMDDDPNLSEKEKELHQNLQKSLNDFLRLIYKKIRDIEDKLNL